MKTLEAALLQKDKAIQKTESLESLVKKVKDKGFDNIRKEKEKNWKIVADLQDKL